MNSTTPPPDAFLKKVRLVVSDPLPVVIHGICHMVGDDPRIRVVGEASTFPAFMRKVLSNCPDVAIVDWVSASEDLQQTTEFLKAVSGTTAILILISTENLQQRKQALQTGARGLLNRSNSAREFRKAIWKVSQGGLWLDNSTAESLLQAAYSPFSLEAAGTHRIAMLTTRERQVMQLVCDGLRNKEIASRLTISENTVWHHLTSVFSKLEVSDRVGLVSFAMRHQFFSVQIPTEHTPIPSICESKSVTSGKPKVVTLRSRVHNSERYGRKVANGGMTPSQDLHPVRRYNSGAVK